MSRRYTAIHCASVTENHIPIGAMKSDILTEITCYMCWDVLWKREKYRKDRIARKKWMASVGFVGQEKDPKEQIVKLCELCQSPITHQNGASRFCTLKTNRVCRLKYNAIRMKKQHDKNGRKRG